MPVSSPNAISILPPAQTSGGSLKQIAQGFIYNTASSDDAALWAQAGAAFNNAQSQIDQITGALRSPLPQAQVIQIVDPSGALVAEIGNLTGTNNQAYPGIWGRNLYVGGTGPDTAPFFANGQIVVVGQNGQVFILDPYANVGAWLGTQSELPKNVTGAVAHSGLIRLTVTAHGWVTGDEVNVAAVGGVPNATGQWVITVIDANTIDLRGSTFAGTYTTGGTAQRYFTGGLFSTIAVGGAQQITNVADNGSGAVRVTVPSHGYLTGYAVVLTGVVGVPNIDVVSWNITVIDANNFDLIGSVFTGAYVSGGLSLNWPTAKFIARDDGSLAINGASITIDSNGITTTINNAPVAGSFGAPAASIVSLDNATGALSYLSPFFVNFNDVNGRTVASVGETAGDGLVSVSKQTGIIPNNTSAVLDGNSNTLTFTGAGSLRRGQSVLSPTDLFFGQTGAASLGTSDFSLAGAVVTDVTGAKIATLTFAGLVVTNGASTVTISTANVDSPGFSVLSVPGISGTLTYGVSLTLGSGSFGTSLTVNTDATGVFGTPGAGQTNKSVVTGVTLNLGTALTGASLNTNSDGFTKGLLTS